MNGPTPPTMLQLILPSPKERLVRLVVAVLRIFQRHTYIFSLSYQMGDQ